MESFQFLPVALPPDSDLRLILAECMPAESNLWGVPAYSFRMQAPGGEERSGRNCASG